METRVYGCDSKEIKQLNAVLTKDPYVKPSFAMQGYKLKDGKMIGGEAGKQYLYIRAEPDFFKFAEEQMKAVPSVKRAEKPLEEKLIKAIDEADGAAEAGLGSIFG